MPLLLTAGTRKEIVGTVSYILETGPRKRGL